MQKKRGLWPDKTAGLRPNWLDRLDAQPIWDSWSTKLYPRDLKEALDWGCWLRSSYGELVSAISRSVCYFLNGVSLDMDMRDLDSRDLYTKKLLREHKINSQLLEVGLDLEFYGNSFSTATPPITRVLRCPRCGQRRYLKSMTRGTDYDYTGGKFISTCSGCRKHHGEFDVIDHPDSSSESPLNVIRWNPLSIDIDYCSMTGSKKMVFTPTKSDRSFVEDVAQSTSLETLPKTLLDTLSEDKSLEFRPGACLHLAVPTDVMNKSELGGWGLPPFLPAFRYVVMLMLLDRQTEAAVKDFILPIRLLFPAPEAAKGGSDPVTGTGILHMGMLRSAVEDALKAQAYQQSSWQMVPSPVGQLQLGGDGKALVPAEILQFAKNRFLDAIGVPQELQNSTLNNAQAPANAMKMFEQTRTARVQLYDDYLTWYLGRCKSLLGWPELTGEVLRPSQSVDPNKTQLIQMMWQQQLISDQTLASMHGFNPTVERTRVREEKLRKAKDERELQKMLSNSDMMYTAFGAGDAAGIEGAMNAAQQQAQGAAQGGAQGGGAPADGGGGGGSPAPAGGGAPAQGGDPMSIIQGLRSMIAPSEVMPDQLAADADQVANILLHTPIGAPRNQILSTVRRGNQSLYDIAKSKLEQLENQSRQQGVEMARQGQM